MCGTGLLSASSFLAVSIPGHYIHTHMYIYTYILKYSLQYTFVSLKIIVLEVFI